MLKDARSAVRLNKTLIETKEGINQSNEENCDSWNIGVGTVA